MRIYYCTFHEASLSSSEKSKTEIVELTRHDPVPLCTECAGREFSPDIASCYIETSFDDELAALYKEAGIKQK